MNVQRPQTLTEAIPAATAAAWEPVHAPLAQHAQQQPEAPFLLAAPALNYRQAAHWVAHVAARHLQPFAGERVALWLNKGNAYALGILAALHAGCAYVPLDGTQPVARAARILQDAQPHVVIADHTHAFALLHQGLPGSVRLLLLLSDQPLEGVPPGLQVVVLSTALDQVPATTLAPCGEQPRDRLGALLYTSGSTGTPKGVQLSHGNLSNFVRWSVQETAITNTDRVLNLASFNFDLSTFDLFASLQAGAAVYVSDERETAHTGTVAELLGSQGISVVYTVPSMLALLNRANAWQQLPAPALRCVMFAGEAMPKPQLQAMAAALPPATHFYNWYGPTETNVCLSHRVSAQDLANEGPVPIGVPIHGANVWLVDEQGRLVQDEGVLGEIWVSDRCVTAGYWARHDPVVGTLHARGMHATGDHGEWRQGVLLFRGRKDRMLKIGGHRVELGEIEATLARHPQLQAVAVRHEPGTPPRLIAHFATRDPAQRLGALALKTYCAQQLPRYMVPHQVVQHADLPRNANGKTDLHALAQWPVLDPMQVAA